MLIRNVTRMVRNMGLVSGHPYSLRTIGWVTVQLIDFKLVYYSFYGLFLARHGANWPLKLLVNDQSKVIRDQPCATRWFRITIRFGGKLS